MIGVGEALGELRVIRHDQQAAGVEIQTAYR